MLVAYVSAHGFGHATRTSEVLRALRRLEPGLPLGVVAAAPESFFRSAVSEPFVYRQLACDVGLAQQGSLVIDEAATADRWDAFEAGISQRVGAEAAFLRDSGARLVLADIPPLGFLAAAAAGVRSVGLANFSWDWIYRHYATRQPRLEHAAAAAAAAYASAELLLELPFAGDLRAFPRREKIPLVARPPRVGRAETWKRLGLRPERPTVLFSFGGLGLPAFAARVLAPLRDYEFLLDIAGEAPPNVVAMPWSRLTASGLTYPDLVAAVDVVVTKPGYGIVSECIACRTRLLYTERGDFPEYPIMLEAIPALLARRHVSNADLMAGRLAEGLAELLAQAMPAPPDLAGADVAARRLLELM